MGIEGSFEIREIYLGSYWGTFFRKKSSPNPSRIPNVIGTKNSAEMRSFYTSVNRFVVVLHLDVAVHFGHLVEGIAQGGLGADGEADAQAASGVRQIVVYKCDLRPGQREALGERKLLMDNGLVPQVSKEGAPIGTCGSAGNVIHFVLPVGGGDNDGFLLALHATDLGERPNVHVGGQGAGAKIDSTVGDHQVGTVENQGRCQNGNANG